MLMLTMVTGSSIGVPKQAKAQAESLRAVVVEGKQGVGQGRRKRVVRFLHGSARQDNGGGGGGGVWEGARGGSTGRESQTQTGRRTLHHRTTPEQHELEDEAEEPSPRNWMAGARASPKSLELRASEAAPSVAIGRGRLRWSPDQSGLTLPAL